MYNWQQMLDDCHQKAFSIAATAPIATLKKINEALNDALKAQESYEEFHQRLFELLAAT